MQNIVTILSLVLGNLFISPALATISSFEQVQDLNSVKSKLEKATVRFEVLELRPNEFYIPFTERYIPLGKKESPITSCSGVFISPHGFLLTAKHCLINNYMDGALSEKLKSIDFEDYGAQLNLLRAHNFRLRIYTNSLMGNFSQDYDTKIVAMGPLAELPYLTHKYVVTTSYKAAVEGMNKVLTFLDKGHGKVDSDWVILKAASIQTFSCLNISTKINPEETIYRLGFPNKNKDLQSDGFQFFVSYGNTNSEEYQTCLNTFFTKGFKNNERSRETFSTEDEFDAYLEYKKVYEQLFERFAGDNVLPIKSKAYEGMSGGPTVNQSGQLLGITTSDISGLCAGYSFSVNINQIFKGLDYLRTNAEDIPKTEEMFSCKNE